MHGWRRLCVAAIFAVCSVCSAGVAVAVAPPAAEHHAPPAKKPPVRVTLEWVGDMAISSQRGLPPAGVYNALAPVRRLLRDADVTLGNLEGTLSIGGASKCGGIGGGSCFAFQAPPSTAGQLHALGFGLVNQANNHSMDYGPSGRAQTIAALNAAGIKHTGLPGQITLLRVRRIKIAFLGFAPYPYDGNLLDIPGAQALVRRARRHAALVVVIIHAGAEGPNQVHTPYGDERYLGEDRGAARAFAHAMIRAGAAIVLGSGPHAIRGVEWYRGRMIAYSLGNFVAYHTLGGGGVLSLSAILRATLDMEGHVVAADWIPIALVDGLPRPDPTYASARLVAGLSRQDFPYDHFEIAPDGVFRFPRRARRASST